MGYNDEHNVFEHDLTCAEWIDEVAKGIGWDTFRRQEELVYMAGEVADRPMTKAGCLDVAHDIVLDRLDWLVSLLTYGVVEDLYGADVDVDEETADEWNEYMGYDEGDERRIVPARKDPKSEEG